MLHVSKFSFDHQGVYNQCLRYLATFTTNVLLSYLAKFTTNVLLSYLAKYLSKVLFVYSLIMTWKCRNM